MPPNDSKDVPLYISRSHVTTEANKTGAWRFLRPRYDEKTAPCGVACPAGEDVGRIQMLASQGLFKEAWETVLLENPFPGICGRICHHPCETVCNRGHFDEAVSVRTIERFLADTASRYELKPHMERPEAGNRRVLIAGAGPSGLAAAYFLALLGYECDVHEAQAESGGVLRRGIPSYRLPPTVLKDEIGRIEAMGVRIHLGSPLDEEALKRAMETHDAVFIGCGRERSRRVSIPGADLPGIGEAMDLLAKVTAGNPPTLKGRVAIIGGGVTAIEAARCVTRLGGTSVLFHRKLREDAPVAKEGLAMATEEGVEVLERAIPVRIEATGDEFLLTIREEAPGAKAIPEGAAGEEKTVSLRFGAVFRSDGFDAAEPWMLPPEAGDGVLKLSHGVLALGGAAPVIHGGDLVNPSRSVVHAVASGKEAAMALDLFFREGVEAIRPGLARCVVGNGRAQSMEVHMNGPRAGRSHAVVRHGEINTDYFLFSPRLTQPRLLKSERTRSFAEIDLKISANLAMREAERCFNCGICNQCDNCRVFCPDLSVKQDDTPAGRHIDYNYCKGCGICVVECPRNAMTLEVERGQGAGEERK